MLLANGSLPDWMFIIVEWVAGVLGLILTLGTLASTTSFAAWWIRVWDFPRLQIAVAAIATAALFAVTAMRDGYGAFENVGIALMIATFAWQSWKILPYTRLGRRVVFRAERSNRSSPNALRLVISNVLQTNDQYDRWLEVIGRENPDVIAAAEVDETWIRRIDARFAASHPYAVKQPLDNLYGLAIWSRLPFETVAVEFVIEDDIPSMHGVLRLHDGTRVRFHCLHPRPPAPGEADSSGPRDAELVVVGRRVGTHRDEHGTPTLVFGDLNDVAWSRTTELFCKLSRLLDIRKGRGFYNTFDANRLLLRYPLDHIFTSPEFRLIDMRVLEHVGSDHFPVCVTLAYEPERQHVQPAEAATHEEQAEATERARAAV